MGSTLNFRMTKAQGYSVTQEDQGNWQRSTSVCSGDDRDTQSPNPHGFSGQKTLDFLWQP